MKTEYVLNTELFTESFMFKYKGNRNIVIGVKSHGVFLIDIDYDNEFYHTPIEDLIEFVSFGDISTELLSEDKLDYFIKQEYADDSTDINSDNIIL